MGLVREVTGSFGGEAHPTDSLGAGMELLHERTEQPHVAVTARGSANESTAEVASFRITGDAARTSAG
jgi:hypothetical protein